MVCSLRAYLPYQNYALYRRNIACRTGTKTIILFSYRKGAVECILANPICPKFLLFDFTFEMITGMFVLKQNNCFHVISFLGSQSSLNKLYLQN